MFLNVCVNVVHFMWKIFCREIFHSKIILSVKECIQILICPFYFSQFFKHSGHTKRKGKFIVLDTLFTRTLIFHCHGMLSRDTFISSFKRYITGSWKTNIFAKYHQRNNLIYYRRIKCLRRLNNVFIIWEVFEVRKCIL